MASQGRFWDAVNALNSAASLTSDLSGPVAAAVGLPCVAVASLSAPLGTRVVCTSDDSAARLLAHEFALGEGPGWQSAAQGAPVSEPHLEATLNTGWPRARQMYLENGVGAVFAFPLRAAGVNLGFMSLYSREPAQLAHEQMTDAEALAQIVARQVLYRAPLPDEAAADADAERWYSQHDLHQAKVAGPLRRATQHWTRAHA